MMEKQAVVRRGYDRLAAGYLKARDAGRYPNKRLLEMFHREIGKKGRILDLGCGAGVPVARFLVQKGHAVVGIDISGEMLRIARKAVPEARFRKMDMARMAFGPNTFDGAVSFYSMIHVPREKHAGIFRRLHKILKPGGIVLAASGTSGGEYYGEFMGERMFWSHHPPGKALMIIRDAGFEIIWGKTLDLGGERQFWIMARNK